MTYKKMDNAIDTKFIASVSEQMWNTWINCETSYGTDQRRQRSFKGLYLPRVEDFVDS